MLGYLIAGGLFGGKIINDICDYNSGSITKNVNGDYPIYTDVKGRMFLKSNDIRVYLKNINGDKWACDFKTRKPLLNITSYYNEIFLNENKNNAIKNKQSYYLYKKAHNSDCISGNKNMFDDMITGDQYCNIFDENEIFVKRQIFVENKWVTVFINIINGHIVNEYIYDFNEENFILKKCPFIITRFNQTQDDIYKKYGVYLFQHEFCWVCSDKNFRWVYKHIEHNWESKNGIEYFTNEEKERINLDFLMEKFPMDDELFRR